MSLRRLSMALLLCSVFALLGEGGALAAVAGEGEHKSITATRAKTRPQVDGRLDDAVWLEAAVDDRFTQIFPADGAQPSMRTTLQVAFDAENLYIAVNALDSEPEKISARLARRDSLIASDFVEVFLDTRHDHDNGYWFRVSAGGVIADAELHDDNRINYDWDAVWLGKAQRHDAGWSAELAIPLSILRFSDRGVPSFGLNVKRGTRRTGEVSQWIYVPRTESGTLSRAGHIVGLDTLETKRTLEFRPFAVARHTGTLEHGGSALVGDGEHDPALSLGVDAKVGLTEGLTLDATVYPDFGQVEADPVVLNLTTFENFFPEKRPFFLEGAGLWGLDLRLIHSRRIGQRTSNVFAGSSLRLDDGRELEVVSTPLFNPILAAARLSGSLGSRIVINALTALTGAELATVEDAEGMRREIELAPPRHYVAARGKYSFGGSSYLGAALTSQVRTGRSSVPEANHDSFAQSIDGRWVRPDGMYRLYFLLASTIRAGGDRYREGDQNCSDASQCRPFTREDGTIQGPGDVGLGGEVGGSKAGGPFRLYSRYRFVSPRFDVDDVGFENDWDYHESYTFVGYNRERAFPGFERASLTSNTLVQYGFDGTRKHLSFDLGASALTRSFWSLSGVVEYTPPKSFTTRETSDGARYERQDELRAATDIATDERRDVSAGIGLQRRHSPSSGYGENLGYIALTARPVPPLELSMQSDLRVSRDNLRVVECQASDDLPCWRQSSQRAYTLALQDSRAYNLVLRINWALSTQLSFEGYMQFFAATGRLHEYRVQPFVSGERPEILRVRDGTRRIARNDQNFSFATLNANLVARWEMRPGSVLMAVYTRAQRRNRQNFALEIDGLASGAAQEVFLLKYTHFANL